MSSLERDPKKRRVKPVDTQASILDFELGESSDDSDFRIEDHPDISDDDDSINSNGDGNDNSSDGSTDDSEEDSDINSYKKNKLPNVDLSIADVIEQAKQNAEFGERELAASQVQVCCGCLGDQSDGSNEIVECDACGTTVHEACYGCSDSASLSSSDDSLSPTAPWFCDTCRAGVQDAVCELCPNTGGIFKETDVGRWVHLVCALYVPGVAFGEVDRLSGVTLFEMPYSRWGAKACCLCPDQRLARTGVCIGCDAGMCRTYFHVTCAQREGFLSEAHTEEVDQADPFYAHCRLHSDKTLVRRRRRNYLALELRTHLRQIQFSRAGHADSDEQVRIQRKLEKERIRYLAGKRLKPPPWVPTQKMPRLLTTSATACRRLLCKAQLMGVDSAVQEMHEAHTLALADIRKKWHIAPAFTVEFIAYYLDRNERMREMKEMLESLLRGNKGLVEEQSGLRLKYDTLLSESSEHQRTNTHLRHLINIFHSTITAVCPSKRLASLDDLDNTKARTTNVVNKTYGNIVQASSNGIPVGGETTASVVGNAVRTMPQQMMVPTAAALKMGVGFPLGRREGGGVGGKGRVLSSHARNQAPSTAPLNAVAPSINSSAANSTANSSPLSLPINERCGICQQPRDQHLMAKCDTCHLHYHLGCLQPPLTRPPKKSKLYGWQCSECDQTSGEEDSRDEMDGHADSAVEVIRKKTVRRSRTRFSKGEDGGVRELIVADKDKNETEPTNRQTEVDNNTTITEPPASLSTDSITPEKLIPKQRSSKERRKSVVQKDKVPVIDSTVPTNAADTLDKLPNTTPTPLSSDVEKTAKVNLRKTRMSTNRMETVLTNTQPQRNQPVQHPLPIQQPHENIPIKNNLSSANIEEEVVHIIVDKKPNKKTKWKGKKNSAAVEEPEEVLIDKRIKIVKIKPLEPKSDDVELATPTVTLQLRQYNDKPSPPPSPIPTIPQPSQYVNSSAPISSISNSLAATINSVAMNNIAPTVSDVPSTPHLASEAGLMGNGIAGQQLYVSKPKKRKREKHRNRYSDDDSGAVVEKHKRKRKKKSLDVDRPTMNSNSSSQPQLPHPRITIKIKSIPLPAGEVASVSNPQCFYVNNESSNDCAMEYKTVPPVAIGTFGKPVCQSALVATTNSLPNIVPNATSTTENTNAIDRAPSTSRRSTTSGAIPVSSVVPSVGGLCCDVCKVAGIATNLVKCDECQKNYHFTCLDPPLKKTPKKRGYSWHCADCDPTESE